MTYKDWYKYNVVCNNFMNNDVLSSEYDKETVAAFLQWLFGHAAKLKGDKDGFIDFITSNNIDWVHTVNLMDALVGNGADEFNFGQFMEDFEIIDSTRPEFVTQLNGWYNFIIDTVCWKIKYGSYFNYMDKQRRIVKLDNWFSALMLNINTDNNCKLGDSLLNDFINSVCKVYRELDCNDGATMLKWAQNGLVHKNYNNFYISYANMFNTSKFDFMHLQSEYEIPIGKFRADVVKEVADSSYRVICPPAFRRHTTIMNNFDLYDVSNEKLLEHIKFAWPDLVIMGKYGTIHYILHDAHEYPIKAFYMLIIEKLDEFPDSIAVIHSEFYCDDYFWDTRKSLPGYFYDIRTTAQWLVSHYGTAWGNKNLPVFYGDI